MGLGYCVYKRSYIDRDLHIRFHCNQKNTHPALNVISLKTAVIFRFLLQSSALLSLPF